MSNENNNEAQTPGWHLRERFGLAVLQDHNYCVVCGELATWRWEQVHEAGRTVAWIHVCKTHTASIVRSKDDPNKIEYVMPEEEKRAFEQASMIWRLKSSTARLLRCSICGENTRWGYEVRGVRLCDEHWTFRHRWRIRLLRL